MTRARDNSKFGNFGGSEVLLDSDKDTSITADTDDQIDIKVGGTDRVVLTPTKIKLNSSGNAEIELKGGTSSADNSLKYLNSAGSRRGFISYDTDNDFMFIGTSNAEKVRIDSSGNVGIGTTSPSKLLSVDGGSDFQVSLRSADTRTGIVFHTPGTGTLGNPSGSLLLLADNTFKMGTASVYGLSQDQSGRITMPYQPAFKARLSADQSNIGTAYTTLQFDTENFDVGSNFNTGTYTFTAPVDGKYLLTAMVGVSQVPTNAQRFILQIAMSGQNFSDSTTTDQFDAAFGSQKTTFKISGIADMDANDTAYVRVYQFTGTQQTDINSDNTYTEFAGIFLG